MTTIFLGAALSKTGRLFRLRAASAARDRLYCGLQVQPAPVSQSDTFFYRTLFVSFRGRPGPEESAFSFGAWVGQKQIPRSCGWVNVRNCECVARNDDHFL